MAGPSDLFLSAGFTILPGATFKVRGQSCDPQPHPQPQLQPQPQSQTEVDFVKFVGFIKAWF